MTTLLAGPDYLDRVRALMRAHGWAVHAGRDEFGPIAYTIGVTSLGAPEVLVRGLDPRPARDLLNLVGQALVAGMVTDGDWLAVPREDGEGERPVHLVETDPGRAPIALAVYGPAGVRLIEAELAAPGSTGE